MHAHGTEIDTFNVIQTKCSCVGETSENRPCILLEITLTNGKVYKFNLFGDESWSSQRIIDYLSMSFANIKGESNVFKVQKGSHPGYIEFTFAGEFQRISGETA